MTKYLTALFVTISAVISFSLTVYAASAVEITSLQKTSGSTVKVECYISDAEENQIITVISCEENDASYTEDVVYIDQFTPEISDGKFSFEFTPADWVTSGKSYTVRVGGNDITEPAELGIIYEGSYIILYGDADGDGILTAADAAIVLQYVLDNDFHTNEAVWIDTIDVDTDNIITSADAASILQKVLDNDFKFTAEK